MNIRQEDLPQDIHNLVKIIGMEKYRGSKSGKLKYRLQANQKTYVKSLYDKMVSRREIKFPNGKPCWFIRFPAGKPGFFSGNRLKVS